MSDIPSSGTIRLDQMHTEVGGTSGTACSLNEADIRGLIGKSSGSSMAFSEWYGAAAEFTIQYTYSSRSTNAPGGARNQYYEWQTYNNRGSATTAVSNSAFFEGNDVVGFSFARLQPLANNPGYLTLDVNGSVGNTDYSWATVSVNGTSYSRSGMSVSYANGRTTWTLTYYPGYGYGVQAPLVSGTNTLVFTKN